MRYVFALLLEITQYSYDSLKL